MAYPQKTITDARSAYVYEALNLEGVARKFFAGCAHDRNACLNKFNNFDNYGGFEFIPNDLGPFKGDPIE